MKLIILVGVLLTIPIWAIEWEIIGQESKLPVYSGKLDADLSQSLGEVTVKILEDNKIPYIGNEAGILSILGTPTGDDAIVIVDGDTMRVYGWCNEVDGIQPSLMPDKFFFASQEAKLRWFFAFIVNDKGKWQECCTPAYLNPLKP